MFDQSPDARAAGKPAGDAAPVATAELELFVMRLARLATEVDDAERITQIEALERLKSAAAAAQARVSVAFDASQRQRQADEGVPADRRGRGIPEQIALARRDSAANGSRHLGFAKALVREMPRTLAALTAGEISEWRATLVVRETATVTAAARRTIDAQLGDRLAAMGDRQVERSTRSLAQQLDPQSVLRRIRGAMADRRVSIRPAPDTMALVTGFLPVAQGVAVFAALDAEAKALKASGDPRTRGQIMADTFTQRITGQASAEAVPVEIQLVMTDRALLQGESTPALIPGYGPVPAAFARDLVTNRNGDAGTALVPEILVKPARVWLRRLYTHPAEGSLIAMDSRRRLFDGLLRRFLVARDQLCRTPWCGAPIRHADHVAAAAASGRTTADNGQGLCERCNYVKQVPGWRSDVTRAGPGHTVRLTTPTGHTYDSTAPPLVEALVEAEAVDEDDGPLARALLAMIRAA